MITDEHLRDIVGNAKSLERAVAELVDAGNRAGGTDNITTLLLQCLAA
jgi:protein phosphatase